MLLSTGDFVVNLPLPNHPAAIHPQVDAAGTCRIKTSRSTGHFTATTQRRKRAGVGAEAGAAVGGDPVNASPLRPAAKAKEEERGEGSEYFPWA